MKKLIAIYLLFCAYELSAQIPGTVTVTGPIAPPATNSPFGATDTRWQKGGYGTWMTNVSQLTDVTWLPTGRKEVGMVEKLRNGGAYELGTNSTTWSALPWWRPEWFGARAGDTNLDCAPAIAACIVQATLAGAGTELGNGTYWISQDIGSLVTPSLSTTTNTIRVRGVAPGGYQDVTETAFGTTIRRNAETTMFTWAGSEFDIRWGTTFDNLAFHGGRYTNAMVQLMFTKDHFWHNTAFYFSNGAAILGMCWWDSVLLNPTFCFTGATNGSVGTIHLVNTNYLFPVSLSGAVANNNLIFENVRAEPANVFIYVDGTGGAPANKIAVKDAKLENHYLQTPMIKLERVRTFDFGGGRSFMAYGDESLSFRTNGINLIEMHDVEQVRIENTFFEYVGVPSVGLTNLILASYAKVSESSQVVFDKLCGTAYWSNGVPSVGFINVMATNYPTVQNLSVGRIQYVYGEGGPLVTTTGSFGYGKWAQQASWITNQLVVFGQLGVVPAGTNVSDVQLDVPLVVNTNLTTLNGGDLTVFKNTNGLGGRIIADNLVLYTTNDSRIYINSLSTTNSAIGMRAFSTNEYRGEVSYFQYDGTNGWWQILDRTGAQRVVVPDTTLAITFAGGLTSTTGNIVAANGLLVQGNTGDSYLYNFTTGGSANVGYDYVRGGATQFRTRVNTANTFEVLGTNSTVVLSAQPTGGIAIGALGAPTITSGSGVPASVSPNGSIYLRTDGTGPNLYVRENSIWVSK